LLKKANTVAVFQLESRGMQGMLKDAQPDRFEDIIALVALYRPGPMDLIPSFCARKHGREDRGVSRSAG
jgi:DNA polymerase-3 subunit alpha